MRTIFLWVATRKSFVLSLEFLAKVPINVMLYGVFLSWKILYIMQDAAAAIVADITHWMIDINVPKLVI